MQRSESFVLRNIVNVVGLFRTVWPNLVLSLTSRIRIVLWISAAICIELLEQKHVFALKSLFADCQLILKALVNI